MFPAPQGLGKPCSPPTQALWPLRSAAHLHEGLVLGGGHQVVDGGDVHMAVIVLGRGARLANGLFYGAGQTRRGSITTNG